MGRERALAPAVRWHVDRQIRECIAVETDLFVPVRHGRDEGPGHARDLGTAPEQVQQHYSTVDQTEMRKGIAKIISVARVREAMGAGGMEVDARNENGQLSSDSQLADSA